MVRTENQRRVFRFRGSVRHGEFRGTHAEVDGDEEIATGSLTLGG